ncbi:hypothetical protein AAIB41_10380 [Brucella sp. BE17]|uniref:hypothetical protein n=1 Tax=Brucella sp. BE17 TaxID=3142977 RepID=UPI0031BA55CA
MQLNKKGKEVAKAPAPERIHCADELIRGHYDMNDYVKGMCYDVAAFVRYLYLARIDYKELVSLSAEAWIKIFNFKVGTEWDGINSLSGSKAVGFWRERDDKVFHAGIAVGGTKIRAINGGALGTVWCQLVDLRTVFVRKSPDGTFMFEGTKIRVYISDL